MARYLVTGATGFLGTHLVDHLLSQGHQVAALCRRPEEALSAKGVEVLIGDVLDGDSVKSAAKGCDGLFHCAGLVSRKPKDAEAMWEVHVTGTRTTLDAAKEAGVPRVVVASTSGVVAVSEEAEEISEDDETPIGLVSRWPYYRSKLFAEQEALKRNVEGFEVIAVNPSLLLGPGDLRGSSTEDVQLFLERKVQAVPAGGISFVDARDAAVAMAAAMDKGRPGERYLLAGLNCSVRDFFGRLERLSDVKAPWLPMPKNTELAKLSFRFLDSVVKKIGGELAVDELSVDMAQHYWYCDTRKAVKELGFRPRDPNDTLLDTIRDLRARGVVWPQESTEASA